MSVAGVVLAAGAGSRLAPLSDQAPKPLLPLLDRSLLEIQIERLEAAGAERIFVNLHHHAAQVERHLEQASPRTIPRVEVELTGPAGALCLFADALSEYDSVLVASSDVLVGEGLEVLLETHEEHGAELTFGVAETTGARRFGVLDVDHRGTIRSAREKPDVPDHEVHTVSAGIYCLSPGAIETIIRLKERLPLVDYAKDLAPALLHAKRRVAASRLKGYWRDIGTPESYMTANRDALTGKIPWLRLPRPGSSTDSSEQTFIHPAATIEPDVQLSRTIVIGAGAHVGSNARLADVVLLPGAAVPPSTVVVGGIVAHTRGQPRSLAVEGDGDDPLS